ncbi:unnamed protein product [Prunus brigantina]
MLGLVTGDEPSPPRTILDFTGSTIENPAFDLWYDKDQSLMIWIISTLSSDLLSHTVGIESSLALWELLEKRFAGKMKEIAAGLGAASQPLTDSDLVAYILAGLPEEYDSFVTSIETRSNLVSSDELHGFLLGREAAILHRKTRSSLPVTHEPFHAYAAFPHHRGRGSHVHSKHRGPGQGQSSFGPPQFQAQFQSRPMNSGSHGLLPTPPVSWQQNSTFGSSSRAPSPFSHGGSSSNSHSSSHSSHGVIVCQFCDKRGHDAATCRKLGRLLNQTSSSQSSSPYSGYYVHPQSQSPSASWIMDTGATAHVTADNSHLQNSVPYSGSNSLQVGDGNCLPISHIGSSVITTPSADFSLRNILHVPHITQNLLSVQKFLEDNQCSLTLYPSKFVIKDLVTQKMLYHSPLKEGMYKLTAGVASVAAKTSCSASSFLVNKCDLLTWHQRLGHPHASVFRQVISHNNLPLSGSFATNVLCSACKLGKASKLPFHGSGSKTTKPLELLHSDVWGPSPVHSISGYKYYVLFLDDFTKYAWIYPMKFKSDVFGIFKTFKAKMENQLDSKVKILRSDSGGEFLSSSFQQFLNQEGIVHQLSCPHTPEQNGAAERKHRHIVELARTLLAASKVPFQFWVDAFLTAFYLINRLPFTSSRVSPFELLFHSKPNYHSLKIFGCQCFPWLKPYSPSKLHPKSLSCVFLGYSLNHSGFRCLDPITNRLYVSRHVTFHESIFPFHAVVSSSSSDSISSSFPIIPLTFPMVTSSPSESPLSSLSSSSPPSSVPFVSPHSQSSFSVPSSSIPVQNTHPMITRSKHGIFKPKALTATKHPLPPSLHSTALLPPTPTTYKQAAKHSVWVEAMKSELAALEQTNTWTLVPPSSNQNLVGSKWVFHTKFKPDGTVDKFKARLVAKGYHQREGLDFHETFSPVAKPTTIRLLLSLAVQYDWFLNQLDVSNAFLHGFLKENVFMSQPPGFADTTRPHFVCQLNKSLYGLKQAPRAWYDELFKALVSLGFRSSQADSSLFIKSSGASLVLVLVYVDDILVTGNCNTDCTSLISHLSAKFPVKDLGPLHYFLGLEVTRSARGMFLSQTKYACDLLKKIDFLGASSCSTPLGSFKLDNSGDILEDVTFYRSTVGALQYLTWTRPDLSYAVNLVCQHLHQPRSNHLGAVKRILRYLKGTLDMGVWFTKGSLGLQAFTDADWAACPIDRRSTSGWCIFLGSNLISWSAKKQPTVSRSSTEAEYRGLAMTAAELPYLSKLFKDIGFQLPSLPLLWCDNQSAIHLASNPVFSARTKHVEVDYHFTRELVQQRFMSIKFVSSEHQLADVFTKPLSAARHSLLRSKLTVRSPPFSLRGAKGSK